ncbi:MAG: nitroreductase [Erysipelotrichaceae bacterium]|nr:nitroreductase [Erysipelotrichaceae bacterium]
METMTILEAIRNRHSVRKYTGEPIAAELDEKLSELIDQCNRESGLHMQLVLDDPQCFDTLLTHYGWFTNANNYIAVIGPKDLDNLEEKAGYYGQKVVLQAQIMGLRTCWVAGTYSKGKCTATLRPDEKMLCVIAIGYGLNDGKPHRSKPLSRLCTVEPDQMPDWFRTGVEAALLAPTAVNQQKFIISLEDGKAVIRAKRGSLAMLDLGIVKCNFEAASGHECG